MTYAHELDWALGSEPTIESAIRKYPFLPCATAVHHPINIAQRNAGRSATGRVQLLPSRFRLSRRTTSHKPDVGGTRSTKSAVSAKKTEIPSPDASCGTCIDTAIPGKQINETDGTNCEQHSSISPQQQQQQECQQRQRPRKRAYDRPMIQQSSIPGCYRQEEHVTPTPVLAEHIELAPPAKANHVFPMLVRNTEQGNQNSKDGAVITAFINLYARTEMEGREAGKARRQRAALNLRARISGDGPQQSSFRDTMRTLAPDPAAQCRTELAHALTMRSELLLTKGEFVPDFNPE